MVGEKDPDFKFSGISRYGKVFPRILGDPAVTWYTKFFWRKNFFYLPSSEFDRQFRFGNSSQN